MVGAPERRGPTRAAVFAAAVLSTLLFAAACDRGCGGAAVDLPSETTARPGAATLETRASTYDAAAGKVIWRGVSRNETERGIVDLALEVEARRADGSVIEKRTVDVVGMRGQQMLLVPGYAAPITVEIDARERPQRVVASIARLEEFHAPADVPVDLEAIGDEAARFRFQSLGHFQLPSGDAKSPFQLSLGIRNVGREPLAAADLQIVFTDLEDREADRLPWAPRFDPPLLPEDAVVVEVARPVRVFASFRVEARGVTLAPATK